LTPEEINEQINKILSSSDFKASRQLSILFKYVAEKTINGRAEEIKAYTIAVEAFNRETSINTQLDPFVRVIASRLRRALEHYYLSIGKDDPIRIEMPRGTYVPVFYRQHQREPDNISSTPKTEQLKKTTGTVTGDSIKQRDSHRYKIFNKPLNAILIIFVILVSATAVWFTVLNNGKEKQAANIKPTIIVIPFENLTGNSNEDILIHSIAEELSNELSLFNDLSVISYYSARKLQERSGNTFDYARQLGIDFAVTGSVQKVSDKVRFSVQLLDLKTELQLWGESFTKKMTTANIFDIESMITNKITNEIAGGYGVIYRNLSKASLGKRETELSVYEAIALFRAYGYSPSADLFQRAFTSLKKAVVTDPQNALARAMLGNLYLDAYALSLAPIDSAYEKGSECIKKAVILDPENQFVRSITGFMYQLKGDREKALESYEKAISLTPNNGYIVGLDGWDMAMLGEFEKGLSIMEQGIKLNPYYPSYFHVAYFLNYFRKGEYKKALDEAEKVNLPKLFWDPMLRVAALAKLGRINEAKNYYKKIVELRPDFPKRAHFYIKCYVYPEDLVKKLLSSLQLAGLKLEN